MCVLCYKCGSFLQLDDLCFTILYGPPKNACPYNSQFSGWKGAFCRTDRGTVRPWCIIVSEEAIVECSWTLSFTLCLDGLFGLYFSGRFECILFSQWNIFFIFFRVKHIFKDQNDAVYHWITYVSLLSGQIKHSCPLQN